MKIIEEWGAGPAIGIPIGNNSAFDRRIKIVKDPMPFNGIMGWRQSGKNTEIGEHEENNTDDEMSPKRTFSEE